MMRVAIVDDEPPARRKLRRLLESAPDVEISGEADCGRAAIELLRKQLPDVVFLDVQMPDMNGFAVLDAIEPRPQSLQIVFVTAFDQHAIDAFEARALDYLLKPVDPERFERTLQRLRTTSARVPKRLALNTGERTVFISEEAIDFFESARNYVLVHAGNDSHPIRSTLEAFAAQMDPSRFIRINRSQFVNQERIREARPQDHGDYRIALRSGVELRWSRRFHPRSHLALA